jgi:drug/metabolite transporter (DMT)-like permease
MATERHLTFGAALGLVALAAIWGFGQVAIKLGNQGISPLMQAGLRSIGSMALVFAWCRWRGIRVIEHDGTLWPGVACGLLFALEFLLLYWGLEYTTAARSVVFLNTSPFFVAIGAHFLIAGDRLTRAKAIGLAAAFSGVVVAFSAALRAPTLHSVMGDAMVLGAATAWAGTTVLIKGTSLSRIRPERTLLYQLATSAIALPLASLALGQPGITNVTPIVALALTYQIVLIAFASYMAWFWYLSRYQASRVAPFAFLSPVFGVIAGSVVLHERLSVDLLIALGLIGGGLWLVNRRRA